MKKLDQFFKRVAADAVRETAWFRSAPAACLRHRLRLPDTPVFHRFNPRPPITTGESRRFQ